MTLPALLDMGGLDGDLGRAARALATEAGSCSACRIASMSPLRAFEVVERDCGNELGVGEFNLGGRGGGGDWVSIANAARGGGGRGPAVA